jgi:hypothetical protein
MLHQSCHSLHKPQQHSAAGPRALHSTFRSFRPLQPPYRPDVMSSHPRVGQLPQQAPSVSSINTNKVHKLSTADVGTSLHSSPAQDLTELAGRILQDGNGVARWVGSPLAQPTLDPHLSSLIQHMLPVEFVRLCLGPVWARVHLMPQQQQQQCLSVAPALSHLAPIIKLSLLTQQCAPWYHACLHSVC